MFANLKVDSAPIKEQPPVKEAPAKEAPAKEPPIGGARGTIMLS